MTQIVKILVLRKVNMFYHEKWDTLPILLTLLDLISWETKDLTTINDLDDVRLEYSSSLVSNYAKIDNFAIFIFLQYLIKLESERLLFEFEQLLYRI